MSHESWDEIQGDLNQGKGYFKASGPKSEIAVGESTEITLVNVAKNTDTKYPIKDKAGTSLGYTWRFFLSDGRVWDVSNANRSELLRGLFPDRTKTEPTPCRVKVTNLGVSVNKQPSVKVDLLGPAT